jgi:hypothetical protein
VKFDYENENCPKYHKSIKLKQGRFSGIITVWNVGVTFVRNFLGLRFLYATACPQVSDVGTASRYGG